MLINIKVFTEEYPDRLKILHNVLTSQEESGISDCQELPDNQIESVLTRKNARRNKMADDSWRYKETRISKNPEYPDIHECQERPIILTIPNV